MSPSTREIRVQIDSRLEFIDLVQEMSDDVTRLAGFDRESVLNVGLAVREAVINAIKHGNRQEHGKLVEIIFQLFPDKLTVRVRDEGDGFDYKKVANPLDPKNLFRADGRGIFFMKCFVDQVKFSRCNGGGTQVLMEKKVTKRSRNRRANSIAPA